MSDPISSSTPPIENHKDELTFRVMRLSVKDALELRDRFPESHSGYKLITELLSKNIESDYSLLDDLVQECQVHEDFYLLSGKLASVSELAYFIVCRGWVSFTASHIDKYTEQTAVLLDARNYMYRIQAPNIVKLLYDNVLKDTEEPKRIARLQDGNDLESLYTIFEDCPYGSPSYTMTEALIYELALKEE